jgi:hypothetical protein
MESVYEVNLNPPILKLDGLTTAFTQDWLSAAPQFLTIKNPYCTLIFQKTGKTPVSKIGIFTSWHNQKNNLRYFMAHFEPTKHSRHPHLECL